jgi:hypothetical protein
MRKKQKAKSKKQWERLLLFVCNYEIKNAGNDGNGKNNQIECCFGKLFRLEIWLQATTTTKQKRKMLFVIN